MSSTEKSTTAENSSLFILIVPLALITVVLVKTWKVILAIIFLGVSWRLWQQYEWQQTKQQIDPYFKTLMEDKRGSIAVLDLAHTAEISNAIASRYLLSKAQRYGAQLLSYGDDRDTYYFLTTGVLQNILADSEPETEFPKFVPSAATSDSLLPKALEDQVSSLPPEPTLPIVSLDAAITSEHISESSESLATSGSTPTQRQSIDYFSDINT